MYYRVHIGTSNSISILLSVGGSAGGIAGGIIGVLLGVLLVSMIVGAVIAVIKVKTHKRQQAEYVPDRSHIICSIVSQS